MDINKIAKYKSDLKLFIDEALKGYALKKCLILNKQHIGIIFVKI